MMRTNVSLARLNTFGLPAVAARYLPLTDPRQLEDDTFRRAPALVLGGGSNLLLLDELPGLTVHVLLGGVQQLGAGAVAERSRSTGAKKGETVGEVRLRVGAGVDWNQLVRYTLDRGWAGLENLILIPGTVGAAPVQNIGAYGAEVAEFITAVHVWEYGVGPRTLTPDDCAFGYRDSRFKREPDRFLITAVDFRLNRPDHELRTGYGAITAELERLAIAEPSAADVALAVTNIRRSKLPDWFFLGNSGSFFKNPVVPLSELERIRAEYPDVPAYPVSATTVKLPAGWLIDRAGLRGARFGRVGSYERQALVVVNHGGATGREILEYSRFVQATVQRQFGVELEREVRLFGSQREGELTSG